MAFVAPLFSRADVNRAGVLLSSGWETTEEFMWAFDVLLNWRAAHAYPMNTFQATLRSRLSMIDSYATVAQRLKRTPSVLLKLRRFPTMNLVQMQDIGGLRAVVSSVPRVRNLEHRYREESSAFRHELFSAKDYISEPKRDGYRSVHLVYRYVNRNSPQYKGLLIELQLRTRRQHGWATAVETMSTFLGQALKSGEGEARWREFFALTSAALAHVEKTPPVPGYVGVAQDEIIARLAAAEKRLRVLDRLSGFAVAAENIIQEKGSGSYHLVVLDSSTKALTIRPFSIAQLEDANVEYARIEERARQGEKVEAVLVSAGPIQELKKAYPNFFLDTNSFVRTIRKLINAP